MFRRGGKLSMKSEKTHAESEISVSNPKISIGCQGWNYADWTTKAGGETIFYPRGTKSAEMLALYAEIYETIEIDSTFYAIPPIATLENWRDATPANFVFSPKMPQEITHTHALRDASFPVLEAFCAALGALGEKLGVVLIQLAPQFEANKANAQSLRKFLSRLPREIRFAVEFRHRGWMIDWTLEELEKNRVALCFTEGQWIPRENMFAAIEKLNNEFAYVRFMGERDLTSFDRIYRHEDANLKMWAAEIEKIKAREQFVYFSNFYEGHAPASADKLKKLLGQKVENKEDLENQGSLF